MTKLSKTKAIESPRPITKWSKSLTIGDTTKEVSVTKAENGFVVNYSKSYYDKNKGYQYINKTWISKTNPLSDEDAETPAKTDLKSIINSLDE